MLGQAIGEPRRVQARQEGFPRGGKMPAQAAARQQPASAAIGPETLDQRLPNLELTHHRARADRAGFACHRPAAAPHDESFNLHGSEPIAVARAAA
jgi:hypothetical protein